MSLTNFVKRVRDIMRNDAGINGDAQRIEQMAWMLFLKVYDESRLHKKNHRQTQRLVKPSHKTDVATTVFTSFKEMSARYYLL